MSTFVKLIKEICQEKGITCTGFSGDWAFLLTKDDKKAFIFGYQFGLDLAAQAAVCKDKAIAADMMEHLGIPCVPHTCFMSPAHPEYIFGDTGYYAEMAALLKKYKKVVCKDNQGTGGHLVFVAETQKELEYAAHCIYAEAPSMCISPYVPIRDEMRCIMLDGKVQVVFRKCRPQLIGDGEHSVQELLSMKVAEDPAFADRSLSGETVSYDFEHGDKKHKKGAYVPKKGESYVLSWKHNLGQGAAPEILYPVSKKSPVSNADAEAAAKAVELAQKVTDAFKLRFVSCDVIRTYDDRYMILEVNNGVMMENLASYNEECYKLAKKIYTKAIEKSLKN